jgi:hypothetical protein
MSPWPISPPPLKSLLLATILLAVGICLLDAGARPPPEPIAPQRPPVKMRQQVTVRADPTPPAPPATRSPSWHKRRPRWRSEWDESLAINPQF